MRVLERYKMGRLFTTLVIILGLSDISSKATACVTRGRFPNNDVSDCRGYTICLLGGAFNYTQYKLSCPVGFVYSHAEQQCTNATSYQCLPTYTCDTIGKFELSNSDCKSFVECISGVAEIVTARLIECPSDQLYSPTEGACVNSTSFECKKDPPIVTNITGSIDDLVQFSVNRGEANIWSQFVLLLALILTYNEVMY